MNTHQSLELNQPVLEQFIVPASELMQTESHRVAYHAWGSPDARRMVVCVHGLSRQGRDFDALAQGLLGAYAARGESVRVICPDVVGRGQSSWLSRAGAYQIPTYAFGLKCMIDNLTARTPTQSIDWVGTSMGGLIGMLICAVDSFLLNTPIRRLVLNDVGPMVRWSFIERLKSYLGLPEVFASQQAGFDRLADIFKGFGPHTQEQWAQLSRPMLKRANAGEWIMHYDPKIAEPLKRMNEESALAAEQGMWQIYDQISCETLLIRGEQSDLLREDDAALMCSRGPKPLLYSVPGVGHAPTLVQEEQITRVTEFLVRG